MPALQSSPSLVRVFNRCAICRSSWDTTDSEIKAFVFHFPPLTLFLLYAGDCRIGVSGFGKLL